MAMRLLKFNLLTKSIVERGGAEPQEMWMGWCSSPSMGSLLNYPMVKTNKPIKHTHMKLNNISITSSDTLTTLPANAHCCCLQRAAGSSSDGTEDSDFSADLEHAEASENARRRSSTRLTRASLRLSRSSQGISSLYCNFSGTPMRRGCININHCKKRIKLNSVYFVAQYHKLQMCLKGL